MTPPIRLDNAHEKLYENGNSEKLKHINSVMWSAGSVTPPYGYDA